MITPELTLYIREALRRKMSFDTIKSELLRVGWAQEDIVHCYDSVFNEIQASTGDNALMKSLPQQSVSPQQAVTQVQYGVLNQTSSQIGPQSIESTNTFQTKTILNIPTQKKSSFLGVFFFVSFIVLLLLAGGIYLGFFIKGTTIQDAVVRSIQNDDIDINFMKELTISAKTEARQNQIVHSLSVMNKNKQTQLDMDILSDINERSLYIRTIPNLFPEESSIFTKQWLRFTSLRAIASFISFDSLPTEEMYPLIDMINMVTLENTQLSQILNDVPLFTSFKKESIVFENKKPYYQLLVTPDYEAFMRFFSALSQNNDVSFENENRNGEEFALRIWMGVFDKKVKKIEILQKRENQNMLMNIGTISFQKKITRTSPPDLSGEKYEVSDFLEKARAGTISNLFVSGIPYADYLRVQNSGKEEEETVELQIETYLTEIIEQDIASSYFLANKKSFVGICKSIDENYSCRESRVGFIVYTQISSANTESKEFLCIDAYTKAIPITTMREPAKLRCE